MPIGSCLFYTYCNCVLQLQERCAAALGFLSVGDPSFQHSDTVLDALFSLKEEKHTDLQFSIGEAIACTAAGPLCDLADDPWSQGGCHGDTEHAVKEVESGEDSVMEKTLKLLLGKYAVSLTPLVRQVREVCCECVW